MFDPLSATFLKIPSSWPTFTIGILVDKDNVINHQLVISYRLLIRILTNQPTVDKTIVLSTKLIVETLWVIVDKIWKLTKAVSVRLAPRASHSHTHRDKPLSRIMCSCPIPPLSLYVTPWKFDFFCFAWKLFLPCTQWFPRKLCWKYEYGRGCKRQKGQDYLGWCGWEICELEV